MRKLIALMATATSGEDEAVKIPMTKELLHRSTAPCVSAAQQTHSDGWQGCFSLERVTGDFLAHTQMPLKETQENCLLAGKTHASQC